jgi:hypothetical protein
VVKRTKKILLSLPGIELQPYSPLLGNGSVNMFLRQRIYRIVGRVVFYAVGDYCCQNFLLSGIATALEDRILRHRLTVVVNWGSAVTAENVLKGLHSQQEGWMVGWVGGTKNRERTVKRRRMR